MVSAKTIPKQWPPDRPLLPQAFIDDYKREQCARALAEAAHEVGAERATVAMVTERARVSRATFYSLFENQQGALLYARQLGTEQLKEAVKAAVAETGSWKQRVAAAMAGLLAVAQEDPHLTEMCLSSPHDEELIAALAALLGEGRTGRENGGPGPRTEELLAHGVFAVVAERLRRNEVNGLAELGASLADVATATFLNGSLESSATEAE